MLEIRAAIASQSVWRCQKADEFPDDVRNANSSSYLGAMEKWLEGLADPTTVLPRLSAAYDALGALVDDPEVYILSGELSQVLGRCGFRQPAEVETPEHFIRDLDTNVAEVLEDQVHEIVKAAKSRELRVRRLANKDGLRLVKGRPRYADSEPGYMLLDVETGGASFGSGSFGYEASLDEVETYLREAE